jgi:aspartyl-tRNA(Asn)/glutamyl-tRNA(Gln) amidotransferase subunit A
MDKLGPMCRTADDCGLVLSVIAGHDPRDHDSSPAAAADFTYTTTNRQQLRIGKVTNAWPEVPADLQSSVDSALAIMEKQGAKISDAELPDGPYEEAAELTILMEAASSFQELITSGRCAELDDPLGRINGYVSMEFSAPDYLQVQRVRKFLQERMDKLFDGFDVLVMAAQSDTAELLRNPEEQPTPPAPGSKKPRHPNESRAPDGVSSLCGLPEVTVPCGFSKDKLPYGLGFMGRALEDGKVIAAANLFQAHTDWHRQRPPLHV